MPRKRVIVTGATGYVGRFITEKLLSENYEVLVLGRKRPSDSFFSSEVEFGKLSLSDFDLDPASLTGCDTLVHAAFHHVQGKYRGGEGNNPEEFRRLNHNSSVRLFEVAKAAGVSKAIFLSSRAVYGLQQPGAILDERMVPTPDSLYGEVKLQTERALGRLSDDDFLPIVIRATGVYGPGLPATSHKWSELFSSFAAGEYICPRVGTEVHGDDLADAVDLLIECKNDHIRQASWQESAPIFNVSDILLDRRDLLEAYKHAVGREFGKLPEYSDAHQFNAMNCDRLRSLGWSPRGYLDLEGMI